MIRQRTTSDLVRSLLSCTCPACGFPKTGRKTLCKSCYFALPQPMRNALYQGVRDGYEEAVFAALERLGMPAPPRAAAMKGGPS